MAILKTASVNLYLTETGRFSGVYQGFVRLTDANADGQQLGAAAGGSASDWGRQAQHGAGTSPIPMQTLRYLRSMAAQ